MMTKIANTRPSGMLALAFDLSQTVFYTVGVNFYLFLKFQRTMIE